MSSYYHVVDTILEPHASRTSKTLNFGIDIENCPRFFEHSEVELYLVQIPLSVSCRTY